jgi:hypothetical protein
MSKFDDEILELEREMELAEKSAKGKSPFPALNNSKIGAAKLAVEIKAKEVKEIDPETIIPESDDRITQRTAEETLHKYDEHQFRELEELCGFCGMCVPCKIFIYNSYKKEISGYSLQQVEARITMYQKVAVANQERERAARDVWEEKLKNASEVEKAERLNGDRQYVPLTQDVKRRVSKAASKVAEKGQPKKRISQDEKMKGAMQKLGINGDMFAQLLQNMAQEANKVKQ